MSKQKSKYIITAFKINKIFQTENVDIIKRI